MRNINKLPLISIAMATYNGEKYLEKQIKSIYSQTYTNIEVIVTDDGSSDGTVRILEQYSKSHGLKYFVNERNLGFVKNFEKVVSLCRGDYIALSDQDDIWLPTKLSTLMKYIGENILACSDAKLIDSNDDIISESFFDYGNKNRNIQLTFSDLVIRNYVTGCTVLMKREILKKAHPIPSSIDYHDWWYGIIASTMGGVYVHPEPLILYRQHEGNHTGAYKSKNVSISIFSKMALIINKNHIQKRKLAGKRIVERLKIYRNINKFEAHEQNILKELILYYKSWGNGFFHLKAFWIALKYRDSIYYSMSKNTRFFACFRSLFL